MSCCLMESLLLGNIPGWVIISMPPAKAAYLTGIGKMSSAVNVGRRGRGNTKLMWETPFGRPATAHKGILGLKWCSTTSWAGGHQARVWGGRHTDGWPSISRKALSRQKHPVRTGGPFKPSFGLSGAVPIHLFSPAVRQPDKAALPLVRASWLSIPTRSLRVLQFLSHSGENCSTPSPREPRKGPSSQDCDERTAASRKTDRRPGY